MFVLLSYLVFDPARELLRKRREKIAGELETAAREQADAIRMKSEYEGKLAAATATLEAMAFYSYKLVTPVYYDLMLKGRYTHVDVDSQKQAEIIDDIRDAKFTDFAMIWSNSLGNLTWFFRENCTSDSITTATKKQQTTWEAKMDDLLEDIESTYWMEL